MTCATAAGLPLVVRSGRHGSSRQISTQGEKLLPAVVAAVGGNTQHPLKTGEENLVHAVPGNSIHRWIATTGAVNFQQKRYRNHPGVESVGAIAAFPGQHAQSA